MTTHYALCLRPHKSNDELIQALGLSLLTSAAALAVALAREGALPVSLLAASLFRTRAGRGRCVIRPMVTATDPSGGVCAGFCGGTALDRPRLGAQKSDMKNS